MAIIMEMNNQGGLITKKVLFEYWKWLRQLKATEKWKFHSQTNKQTHLCFFFSVKSRPSERRKKNGRTHHCNKIIWHSVEHFALQQQQQQQQCQNKTDEFEKSDGRGKKIESYTERRVVLCSFVAAFFVRSVVRLCVHCIRISTCFHMYFYFFSFFFFHPFSN